MKAAAPQPSPKAKAYESPRVNKLINYLKF